MAEIYCITNVVNGKKYIGATSRSGLTRFREHCTCARGTAHKYLLHQDMVNYGIDNFRLDILESNIPDGTYMYEREKYWIRKLGSYAYTGKGYNLTKGGYGTHGWVCTKERSEKLSKALTGRPFSLEHRKNISEAMKGNCVGEKNAFFGKTHSNETKQIIAHKNAKGAVLMLDPDTLEPIKEFFCVNEAARWLVEHGFAHGVPNSAACVIGNNLKDPPDRHKSYCFRWRYK